MKTISAEEAVAMIPNGARLMVGGFIAPVIRRITPLVAPVASAQ